MDNDELVEAGCRKYMEVVHPAWNPDHVLIESQGPNWKLYEPGIRAVIGLATAQLQAELDAVRGEMDGLRFAASQALASLNLAIVSGAFPLEKDVAVANAKRLSEALALPVQGSDND